MPFEGQEDDDEKKKLTSFEAVNEFNLIMCCVLLRVVRLTRKGYVVLMYCKCIGILCTYVYALIVGIKLLHAIKCEKSKCYDEYDVIF